MRARNKVLVALDPCAFVDRIDGARSASGGGGGGAGGGVGTHVEDEGPSFDSYFL